MFAWLMVVDVIIAGAGGQRCDIGLGVVFIMRFYSTDNNRHGRISHILYHGAVKSFVFDHIEKLVKEISLTVAKNAIGFGAELVKGFFNDVRRVFHELFFFSVDAGFLFSQILNTNAKMV